MDKCGLRRVTWWRPLKSLSRSRQLEILWTCLFQRRKSFVTIEIITYYRRKLRSQTSDDMDRWKSRGGKNQRREEERRSEKRKSQKKEDADARKGRKVAKHCVFPMIWGSGWSKSSLAKAAGAEPAGQMRNRKLHAAVARSTFLSQNVQNTPTSDHFWKLRCRKSAHRCGAKHVWKSKCTKHTRVGALLEVEMSKKCTPLWREANLQVKMCKTHTMLGPLFDVQMSFRVAGARDCAPCQKWAKREDFVAFPKNDGRCETFEEDLERCIFHGRRSTRDMFIRDVRRSARWFPERGCILEHQIFIFGKMILRDRCSTLYDLASLFGGRRSTLDRWSGKIANALVPGRQLCTQRIASFLMLSTLKSEETSLELLRFWCCQFQN